MAEIYNTTRVGPLNDELWDDYRSLDREVLEISWIPQRLLPRTSTGKWQRLKVKGHIPTKVTISGLAFFSHDLTSCPSCAAQNASRSATPSSPAGHRRDAHDAVALTLSGQPTIPALDHTTVSSVGTTWFQVCVLPPQQTSPRPIHRSSKR